MPTSFVVVIVTETMIQSFFAFESLFFQALVRKTT